MNMVCNVKANVELMVSMKGDIGVIQSQNIPIPGTTALQEVRFLCLVHLPGQNIFCPRLKSSHLLRKRIEKDFLAEDKKFSLAKKSFSIHFTSKYISTFFSLRQNILSRYMDEALSYHIVAIL